MRGFLAVEGDGNTIVGITYFEHSETPWLGAEVNNPRWQAQWEGKQIFDEDGELTPAIRVVQGGGSGDYEVDGLSGATLTVNGVNNMLQFWLSPEGFGEYLAGSAVALTRKTLRTLTSNSKWKELDHGGRQCKKRLNGANFQE